MITIIDGFFSNFYAGILFINQNWSSTSGATRTFQGGRVHTFNTWTIQLEKQIWYIRTINYSIKLCIY